MDTHLINEQHSKFSNVIFPHMNDDKPASKVKPIKVTLLLYQIFQIIVNTCYIIYSDR